MSDTIPNPWEQERVAAKSLVDVLSQARVMISGHGSALEAIALSGSVCSALALAEQRLAKVEFTIAAIRKGA